MLPTKLSGVYFPLEMFCEVNSESNVTFTQFSTIIQKYGWCKYSWGMLLH